MDKEEKKKSEVAQSCPALFDTRLLRPWDFLGKSTGVGCHFLLQGTSRPRDWTQVSHIVDRCFTVWATRDSNYHTIAFISYASKTILKILQARLQLYLNQQLPDVQAGFRKGRGTTDQSANIHQIIEKAREFQKCFASASLTMLKPWLCGSQQVVEYS